MENHIRNHKPVSGGASRSVSVPIRSAPVLRASAPITITNRQSQPGAPGLPLQTQTLPSESASKELEDCRLAVHNAKYQLYAAIEQNEILKEVYSRKRAKLEGLCEEIKYLLGRADESKRRKEAQAAAPVPATVTTSSTANGKGKGKGQQKPPGGKKPAGKKPSTGKPSQKGSSASDSAPKPPQIDLSALRPASKPTTSTSTGKRKRRNSFSSVPPAKQLYYKKSAISESGIGPPPIINLDF